MLKNLFGGLKGGKSEPAANEPGAQPAAATPDPAAQPAPSLPPTFGFVMHQAVHDNQQRVVA